MCPSTCILSVCRLETDQVWHLHLRDILATESVDNASNRRSLALANKVEIEHALDSSCLETAVLLSVLASPGAFPQDFSLTRQNILSWGERECVLESGSSVVKEHRIS